jgi:hypothetical protein
MRAAGRWAWWNQYGNVPLNRCAERAKEAELAGVIVKWGYPEARAAFSKVAVPWATERYVYPDQPEVEGRRLANDVSIGAAFAVINAEVEWEAQGPDPMRRLIAEFRRHQPTAELYASADTRGNRTTLPYQRVLFEHVAGVMPMIYPMAFEQSVAAAFAACLDGKDFRGKPVLPTIQTYGAIGSPAVAEQIAEVHRRGLPGYQAYTITHATDAEWAEILKDKEEDMVSQADFDAFVRDVKAQQEFQNKGLVSLNVQIRYLAEIAVNHEARLKALGG